MYSAMLKQDVISEKVEENMINQSKSFKYWRIRTMLAMMIGYAFFYIIRQAFPAVLHEIEVDLGYSKTQLGAIFSSGALLYGVGKCFAGFVGDRVSARYLMAFGLFMSGLTTFIFGMCDQLSTFMITYVINMGFQSLGWPSCARLLTHWFSARELATKWALWNSSQQIGGAVIMLLSGWILVHYNWRYVFYISSVLSMLMAVVLVFLMRDTPESLGLSSIEEHHGLDNEKHDENLSLWDILLHNVLRNKLVWYMCLANFFVYITRISVFTWGPTLLQEVKGSSIKQAMNLTAAYDIAGIFGGLLAGYLSDKVFKGYRGRAGALFMLGISLSVIVLWFSPQHSTNWHLIGMVLIGFMVSGPQILVGVAAVDFSSKKTAGVATGLTGTVGYIGTAFAGAGLGAIIQYYGWNYAFLCMVISGILGAFFFALTWNHRSKTLN